jgi:hypothetical protein
MNTTTDQMENKLDISSLTVEEAQELIERLDKHIEENCNVATPFIKSIIDNCYSDTRAATIDITAKILADFESWQGSGKLTDVIVNLMNWYRQQRPDLPKLNLIFQSDAIDNEEAQQLVRWPAQKAANLRKHPYNDSYPFIQIHYEKETQRLGILCNIMNKPERPTFVRNLVGSLLKARPHKIMVQRKDLPAAYFHNLYMIKQHLIHYLPNHEIEVRYYPEYIFISLKDKNNS